MPTRPARERTPRWRAALPVAFLVTLLVGVGYGVVYRGAHPGSALEPMPEDCVRAYAAVPTPADSGLADAVSPHLSVHGRGETCGYYRGVARIRAAKEQAERRQASP